MKKHLIIANLLLAGSLFGASDDAGKWYIGAGMMNGSGTHSVTRTNGYSNYDIEFDVSIVPVSIGKIGANNNRVEVSLISADIDFATGEKAEISGYDINYDITLESLKSGNLLPYVGAGMGFYNWDNSGSLFQDGEDLKGVGFNLNAGLLYSIDKTIEFEVAYQTRTISWQDIQYTNYTSSLNQTLSGIYVGLNLKF